MKFSSRCPFVSRMHREYNLKFMPKVELSPLLMFFCHFDTSCLDTNLFSRETISELVC